jgi:hypothetical protein
VVRKSKTQQLIDGALGQQLALSVAAHLARTQLVPEPLRPYDSQHLTETLDIVARALARVSPVYVVDAASGAPRELTPLEIEGALIQRGATVIVLRDGRKLSGMSIKRADLRHAIAILKTVGIPELRLKQASSAPSAPPARVDRVAGLAEIEALLRPPLVPAQIERANRIAVSIARDAPHGRVANLAMQLVSAMHEARADASDDPARVRLALARLRAALEEVQT